jgi:hypothetical protein
MKTEKNMKQVALFYLDYPANAKKEGPQMYWAHTFEPMVDDFVERLKKVYNYEYKKELNLQYKKGDKEFKDVFDGSYKVYKVAILSVDKRDLDFTYRMLDIFKDSLPEKDRPGMTVNIYPTKNQNVPVDTQRIID